ncbi:ankyrin repeat protein [Ancylostoma caninum]|uniref:Ankyrin repeat protein n=1 Tax=Ancylostoma caninum TaxID=29170 RepID=A0A368GQC5_ANCCA|nr:ankyrin repeat protein [Ancylostoma caninum]
MAPDYHRSRSRRSSMRQEDDLPDECNQTLLFCFQEKTISRVPRKPKEGRKEGTETESSGRGPTAEQLSWLRACRTGDLNTCKKLLDSNPDILQYVPPHHLNYSCVHIATQGRYYELLRLFKEKGANFNAATRSGYTPLHLAAQNQDKDTVKMLIQEFGEFHKFTADFVHKLY